ncbi:MAG TPA: TOMM precursor leader peptide-binding protein [Candidatus Wallbacteria bacterium]|nr:TOMM precursor leader peptide-binding protein [Candidatus Wallbacteria bacterium]
MNKKIIFKNHFHVEIIDSDSCVILVSENSNFVLKGRLYCLIARMLDGSKDADEIVDALETEVSGAEVYFTLEKLKHKGYITEKNETVSSTFAAYWSLLGVSEFSAKEALENTLIKLTAIADTDVGPLEVAIKNAGMSVEVCGTDSAFEGKHRARQIIVIAAPDYLYPELFEINRNSIKKNIPWMLIKPSGAIIWIGPIFIPGRTGCFECLAQRLKTNRDIEMFIQSKKNDLSPIVTSRGTIPSSVQMAYQMAAQQLAIWAVQNEGANLAGRVISVNTTTLLSQEHILTKRPQCPACNIGSPADEKPNPPVLKSIIKDTDSLYGGCRTMSPEETFNKFSNHVSPITGVVNSLVKAESGSDGILNVYFAGQNSAMRNNNIMALQKNLRSMSAGKGITEIAAKTGALCEAIERYSGLYNGNEPKIKTSYSKIKDQAVLPNDCMNYSDEQFKNRNIINSQGHHFQTVPEPFDENAVVEWTPFWSLEKKEWRYVISSYCYYGYHDPEGHFFSWPNSNGCASGNTLEEAILQGFFEINERDAVALWWYNMIKRPAVDLESFNIAYIEKLYYAYKKKNRKFWVLDITSDTGIPTFTAVSYKPDSDREEIVFAFGSHFDPKTALIRALTEMNQFMPSVLEDSPGEYSFKDPFVTSWWKNAKLRNESYLAPDKTQPARKLSDFNDISSNDMLADINRCVNLMDERGMRTLILDQTQPDVGLNVVKIIVPGMRHMWQRLGPGRLYDIPVEMGWLKKPKKENEMNKTAIFV